VQRPHETVRLESGIERLSFLARSRVHQLDGVELRTLLVVGGDSGKIPIDKLTACHLPLTQRRVNIVDRRLEELELLRMRKAPEAER
jgi:hypothetical protein